MLPRSFSHLYLCLTALLILSTDSFNCHKSFSRRGTPSLSASSHQRFARRSSPRLHNHLFRRSPILTSESLSTPSPHGSSKLASHSRRSIDFDQSNDGYTSESLDQQRDQAEKMWEEFVESNEGEDVDLYPDCDDQLESVAVFDPTLSSSDVPPTSHPSDAPSHLSSPDKKNKGEDPHAQEVAKNKKIEEAKQAKKEAEAQLKKQHALQQAQADKKQAADEAAEEQKAAEAIKEQEAADAKKKEEAAEAAKAKEAAEAAQRANKHKEAYQVTNLAKIQGTGVTTGTARPIKDETYASPASSDEHTGDATFFTPDVGACGVPNTPSDYIVAVSHLLYDSFPSKAGNPNTNAICHKKIRATYDGRNVTVTVTDRCEGCDMYSLDFTETAFQQLGSKDEGRLHGMTWTFIS